MLVFGGMLCSGLLGLDQLGVAVVEGIPQGLPDWSLPGFAPGDLRQLLPVACLLGCTVAFGLALFDPRALLVPAAYIALCLITGIFVAVRETDPAALGSGVAAIVMHMSWASGFLVGLAKSMLAQPQQDARAIGTT